MQTKQTIQLRQNRLVWVFFACVYLGSWTCWIPLVIAQQPASLGLLLLGILMPSLLGIAFTYGTQDRAGRRVFWFRVGSVRRIGFVWGAAIVLLFPVLGGLAWLLYQLIGGVSGLSLAAVARLVTDPAQFLVVLLTLLIGGPLAEELGWRGFAPDRLQARWNPLVASLVLGSIWAVWHVPLFFVPRTVQNTMGIDHFWLFFLSIVSLAILITGVYNHTHQSILAAILLHFMFNATTALTADPTHPVAPGEWLARTLLLVVLALAVGLWEVSNVSSG
jgi:uncharacterized protein